MVDWEVLYLVSCWIILIYQFSLLVLVEVIFELNVILLTCEGSKNFQLKQDWSCDIFVKFSKLSTFIGQNHLLI